MRLYADSDVNLSFLIRRHSFVYRVHRKFVVSITLTCLKVGLFNCCEYIFFPLSDDSPVCGCRRRPSEPSETPC